MPQRPGGLHDTGLVVSVLEYLVPIEFACILCPPIEDKLSRNLLNGSYIIFYSHTRRALTLPSMLYAILSSAYLEADGSSPDLHGGGALPREGA
jgi:hypothetical protein